LVEKLKDKKSNFMNEVVFHDPVPMKYLCMAIIHYNISWKVKPKVEDDTYSINSTGLLFPIL
jgi:hypothetical protein